MGGMSDAVADHTDDAPRTVVDEPDQHRYEIRLGADLAGFAI